MEKVDLHIHSNNSDGSENLEELVRNIEKANIKIFSLTDHDTVAGCKVIQQFIPENIKFIKGIELTCKMDNLSSHVLGYNCELENKELTTLINKGKKLRKEKLNARIEYLKNTWNITLTKEELSWLNSIESVVKTHLGVILVKRKLAKNNLEAMDKYLSGCKKGNTKFYTPEAVETIKSSGGIAVWAHPLGGEGEQHISKEEFLKSLKHMLDIGIKGLECYYSRYSTGEIEFLIDCAKKNSLYISAGSDYHGKNKTVELGKISADNISVEASEITILKALGF